jgi:maltose O-acetyltransferase
MTNGIDKALHDSAQGAAADAGMARIRRVVREELGPLQPRLLLAGMASRLIPHYVASRLRTAILRLAGLQIGSGTLIWGTPQISGPGQVARRLTIGAAVVINIGCFFDLNDTIAIGDHVAIGHEVLFLTASHAIGGSFHRAAALRTAPVRVERGAWIGARSLILPGVTVGAGSIVAAGSVVAKDVPPDTLVGGVPARPIRALPTA